MVKHLIKSCVDNPLITFCFQCIDGAGYVLVNQCKAGTAVLTVNECKTACVYLGISKMGAFKEGRPCYRGASEVCNQNIRKPGSGASRICKGIKYKYDSFLGSANNLR